MKFSEYLEKIYDACIVDVEETWCSYVEPAYKVRLKILGLEPSVVEDYEIGWDDVSEMLKLEVERRLAVTGKGRKLGQWVYEVIDGTLEPSMSAEQTEIINQMLELFKDKKEIEEKKKLLDVAEQMSKNGKLKSSLANMVSYTKKDIKN